MGAKSGAHLGFEDRLWNAADKLRDTMDAAEYKHVVLGLIFLKYISDTFLEKQKALHNEPYADPEGPEEHTEEMGWVPKGWEVSTVGNDFDVTMGASPPSTAYNEEQRGIAFLQGRADFGFRYLTDRVFCTELKRFAQKDDTLVSVRASVGDVNMAQSRLCIGRGLAAVRHKSGSRSFTYYSMQYLKEYFDTFETGATVFGSISKKDFKDLKWLRSALNQVSTFESSTPNRWTGKSNRILAKKRDILVSNLLLRSSRTSEIKRKP